MPSANVFEKKCAKRSFSEKSARAKRGVFRGVPKFTEMTEITGKFRGVPGSSGELRGVPGSSGELRGVPGHLGEVPGSSGAMLYFRPQKIGISAGVPGSSGGFRESSGEFRGVPGSFGEVPGGGCGPARGRCKIAFSQKTARERSEAHFGHFCARATPGQTLQNLCFALCALVSFRLSLWSDFRPHCDKTHESSSITAHGWQPCVLVPFLTPGCHTQPVGLEKKRMLSYQTFCLERRQPFYAAIN